MPQFLIAVLNNPDSRSRPLAVMEPIWAAVGTLNEQALDDGILVFAGGLEAQSEAVTVDPRSGTPVISHGPRVASPEYLGGFWVIEVADCDAALAWAELASQACQEVLEVRAFMAAPPR